MRHALIIGIILVLSLSACSQGEENPPKWWKGNLHTHSLWSDGDDYPEMIIDWYKEQGYHFLSLSDHNILSEGDRWIDTTRNNSGTRAYTAYVDRFGEDWVETRMDSSGYQVRLKTLNEFRPEFEEEGAFLLIQSEEISDGFDGKPIHINATNVQELIEPQQGGTLREVIQNNVDAVLDQRERLGIKMFPHINHPNFGWAITAEDLISLMGEQFFEVYNGHPAVNNYGDENRPGLEQMWDIITTRRIIQGRPIMYGMAVDDSHNYHEVAIERANSGRAWVMVKSDSLTVTGLIDAMERGDFYGSTGVELVDVKVSNRRIAIEIKEDEGMTYETHFIGTRVNHDSTSTAVEHEGSYVTRSYSPGIGEIMAVVEGNNPVYEFTGDELYVRAKVISSKLKVNPYREGETEVAWTQPVVP
ncbi:MAG: hypothetical protein KTR29_25405 [Rhodothermaceae bacterium]|nr:hypothetical protein [Rhodothermaceae bacterium]